MRRRGMQRRLRRILALATLIVMLGVSQLGGALDDSSTGGAAPAGAHGVDLSRSSSAGIGVGTTSGAMAEHAAQRLPGVQLRPRAESSMRLGPPPLPAG